MKSNAKEIKSKATRSQSQVINFSCSNAFVTDSHAPKAEGTKTNIAVSKAVARSLLDYSFILSLVFGGCCTNVWSYERILKMDSHLGTALTFSQMCFITLHSLPSFLEWAPRTFYPRLKQRSVPLRQWAVQVLVLTFGTLLNNWAFAFHVPLTVQIVFRSAGLAVSMVFGYLFLHKRYTLLQICSVAVVSVGVIIATLSRPSATSTSASGTATDVTALSEYSLGVLMLTFSLLLTGALGMLQERTYSRYGPCWKEGVFYTHFLSLPIFLFLIPEIKHGFRSLSTEATPSPVSVNNSVPLFASPIIPYIVLLANLITQLICVSGVNQLTSRVSSVSTNIVLTTRKAISLCFSVWWFGNGWNTQLGIGAGMVFLGSLLYTLVNSGSNEPSDAQQLSSSLRKKEE
ncbi:hypothetical protein AcV7_007234 [Taiwanofungus camphoratus]|nr:hypothetical protein AcV7_007234 [Antrodia cinnamomea]